MRTASAGSESTRLTRIPDLLLPCNVIFFEDESGQIVVFFAKPKSLFKIVDDPKLAALAETVDEMIEKAFRSL